MKAFAILAGVPLAKATAATAVFTQPSTGSGGLLLSSWWTPNGSDYDQYFWDNCWIQIEAAEQGIPDWGLATGTGNGVHFRQFAYVGEEYGSSTHIVGGDVTTPSPSLPPGR